MKATNLVFLVTAFFLFSAFTSSSFMWMEETASFNATVDGISFKLSDGQLFRGLLVNRAASMDGKIPARTVITTTFTGPADGAEGRLINDNLQFEIDYQPDKTGEPTNYVVAMQFKNAKYYMLKDQSKLTVISFTWEEDKKHFVFSAEFNCIMRSFGYPSDGFKDVRLKGRMENIRITVPSWIAAKPN
jgi:hypothetical protein